MSKKYVNIHEYNSQLPPDNEAAYKVSITSEPLFDSSELEEGENILEDYYTGSEFDGPHSVLCNITDETIASQIENFDVIDIRDLKNINTLN